MNTYTLFKSLATTAGAWLCAALAPAAPYGVVCTLMVAADVISARRLAHRLGRRKPSKRQLLKFSSARFGHSITKLLRIYALLTLAALLQHTFQCPWFDLLKGAAAAVCIWQGCSILENEASANSAPWAKIAGKILVDKTARHLGLNPHDLADFIDFSKEKSPKSAK